MDLVHGYLPDVDQLILPARRKQLVHRSAVICNSIQPENPDAGFDVRIYLRVLKTACELLKADGFSLGDGKEGLATVTLQEIETVALKEDDPPKTVWIVAKENPVGIVQYEPWNRVGGPEPYHDSYTYALYSKESLFENLKEEIGSFHRAGGGKFIGVAVGGMEPKFTLMNGLLNMFRLNQA